MEKYVIYTGVLFMPDKNAAAQRAMAISKMIANIGYQPVVIGMNPDVSENDILRTEIDFEGIKIYEMKYPKTSIAWLKMLFDFKPIVQVIKHLKSENCQALIAMDYFSGALYRMKRFCKQKKIRLIADSVDWFEKSNYRFPKNIIKDWDTKIRMKCIYPKMNYMIAISTYLYEQYKNRVSNIVELPGVVLPTIKKDEYSKSFRISNCLNLSFVGVPGKKFEKEKVDWLIQIICNVNRDEKRIVLHVAGIDLQSVIESGCGLTRLERFDESVIFYGRLEHESCIDLIKQSDFAVIVREDTLLSRAGFPTKLGEAFACGTPVFVTPTSNIVDYIPSSHGIVTDKCTYESVERKVYELLELGPKEIDRMRQVVEQFNPLDYQLFVGRMKKILEN